MEFRTKTFPYPLLEKDSTDYKSSFLNISMEYGRYGSDIEMVFEAKLENEELIELFQNNSIAITVHIECPATSYRKVFLLDKEMTATIKIPEEILNGKVEISSFIVAITEIKNYSSKDFEDFLKGYTFDFEIGAILGVGNQFSLLINKETEELINVVSIFKIMRNPNIETIDYDASQHRISIYLPEKEFGIYNLLRNQVSLQPILSAMIIVPVLTEMLTEIKSLGADEYQDLLWFNSLEKQLNEKFNLSMIDGIWSRYTEKSMFFLAQELINYPVSKGLGTLVAGYSSENIIEDGEEA
ncbi:hypothetical protein ED221_RS01780 [Enterococcus hirae]